MLGKVSLEFFSKHAGRRAAIQAVSLDTHVSLEQPQFGESFGAHGLYNTLSVFCQLPSTDKGSDDSVGDLVLATSATRPLGCAV